MFKAAISRIDYCTEKKLRIPEKVENKTFIIYSDL